MIIYAMCMLPNPNKFNVAQPADITMNNGAPHSDFYISIHSCYLNNRLIKEPLGETID